MPTLGVSMRKIRTILRLHHESKLSQRQISRSVQLSIGAVNKYLARAVAAGLSWPLPDECQDDVKVISCIKDPMVITKILTHVQSSNLSSQSIGARDPPALLLN